MIELLKKKYAAANRYIASSSIFYIILFTGIFCYSQSYAGPEVKEYQIKAGFIYRFILFVKWPEQDDFTNPSNEADTIIVGIVGKDSFENFFASVENRLIPKTNKKLKIRRFGSFREGLEINKCHVLFISSSERKNLRRIFSTLKDVPTLTISEIDNFCEDGGIINLVTISNRIRYEVNLSKAQSLGLTLSSNFLRTAIRVVQEDEPQP